MHFTTFRYFSFLINVCHYLLNSRRSYCFVWFLLSIQYDKNRSFFSLFACQTRNIDISENVVDTIAHTGLQPCFLFLFSFSIHFIFHLLVLSYRSIQRLHFILFRLVFVGCCTVEFLFLFFALKKSVVICSILIFMLLFVRFHFHYAYFFARASNVLNYILIVLWLKCYAAE